MFLNKNYLKITAKKYIYIYIYMAPIKLSSLLSL